MASAPHTAQVVLGDLAAETAWLDELVAERGTEAWSTPTPAHGWSVADQIGHLAWTDDIALTAVRDPDEFARRTAALVASPRGMGAVDDFAHEWAADARLLERWRNGRASLANALATVSDSAKIPWFGPPMSATSMATARLMETWAHGQDVADAFGVVREPTARLRHVAHIGVRTRDFAYVINGERPPATPFRVELTAPTGETWTWGPSDATQRVTGSALDFCLLVTQRRHRSDLDVVADGPDAEHWLGIAQAFAGPPGTGRPSTKIGG
jgi:uncharacterized protein (TIGR03084 family)